MYIDYKLQSIIRLLLKRVYSLSKYLLLNANRWQIIVHAKFRNNLSACNTDVIIQYNRHQHES